MQIKHNYKNNLFNLIFVSAMLGLNLLVVFVFNYLPHINGVSIEIYVVTLIISLMIIPNKIYASIFIILFPFFKLLVEPAHAVNFYDLIMEYFCTIYIFYPLIFISFKNKDLSFQFNYNNTWFIKRRNNARTFLIFLWLFLIYFIFICLHGFFFVWAGYLWYTNYNWLSSFIYEISGFWVTLLVDLILLTSLSRWMIKIKYYLLTKYA